MKKLIVLLLVAFMLVGILVSCEEDPRKPIASEEAVENVGFETVLWFYYCHDSIEKLAAGKDAEEIYESLSRFSGADIKVDTNLKILSFEYAVNKENLSALFYNVSSSNSEKTSGDFVLSCSLKNEGNPFSMMVMGHFSFVDYDFDITYSIVNYNSTDYDVAAFNEFVSTWEPSFG